MLGAVILCGGLGTRLRARVAGRPKALALVQGRPFLSHQLDWLAGNGLFDVTLAAGYLGDQIKEFARDLRDSRFSLTVVCEAQPLGSGGAIVNAVSTRGAKANLYMVLNGDTLLDFDTAPLLRQHKETGAKVTLVVSEVEDISRFGTVDIVANRIIGFEQPSGLHKPGVVSAGVYVLAREQIMALPKGGFSIERDCFPRMAAEGWLFAYRLPVGHSFFDIGTSEAFDLINRKD
jgi:D-glycero-alpha-D-manno-heptose 1-phosphate guanylyltransferase